MNSAFSILFYIQQWFYILEDLVLQQMFYILADLILSTKGFIFWQIYFLQQKSYNLT